MKKLSIVLGVAAMVVAQGAFGAMTATLSYDGGNANGGGIFLAQTSQNGTFDTFCMSIQTEFNIGDTYNYSVSPTVVANNPVGSPSYVTVGTAYIYHEFLAGVAAYGGTRDGTTLDNVQETLWFLQGLLTTTGTGTATDPYRYWDPRGGEYTSGVNSILAQVEADLHTDLAGLEKDGTGNPYGVEFLNLHDGTYQPQLIAVPEPPTLAAAALLLLPFGASTLRILRKREVA